MDYKGMIIKAMKNTREGLLRDIYRILTWENDEEQWEQFRKWAETATPEERELQCRCYDYAEEYFEDMTLSEGTMMGDVMEIASEWYDYLPKGIEDARLRFLIVDSDEYSGSFNATERVLKIDRRYLSDKSVILHELIHFFEWHLETEYPLCIRELLVIRLYKKLLPQIQDLDERITAHCELFEHEETFRHGGEHGVLFFLKSLDLDIRCGYPLGTVCGYGRGDGEQ